MGENLLPLTIGNTWTYKVSPSQEERFVVRAVRKEMVGEQTCVLLEASLKDRVVATELLAFARVGGQYGLFRFRVDKDDVDPPLCVLRLPLPGGKRWSIGKSEYRLGTRTFTPTFWVTNEERTVPFGKFKTTVVHASFTEGGRGAASSISYAERVGIVRQTIDEGKRTLVLELEKFETGDGR